MTSTFKKGELVKLSPEAGYFAMIDEYQDLDLINDLGVYIKAHALKWTKKPFVRHDIYMIRVGRIVTLYEKEFEPISK